MWAVATPDVTCRVLTFDRELAETYAMVNKAYHLPPEDNVAVVSGSNRPTGNMIALKYRARAKILQNTYKIVQPNKMPFY